MNVHLTFDVEIWCNGWDNIDEAFPNSFNRYIYGRSSHGDFALPKTIEILNNYGLKGVFFVEPLFAARFGTEHLKEIVDLIRNAGQEVQLHLHPEWTDEVSPPIIQDISKKRQHLAYYTVEEQIKLIAFAKTLLESAGSGHISAFRAGSYASNRDTFDALSTNSIPYDSSPNRCYPCSAPDLRADHEFTSPFDIGGVTSFPVTVFTDGFGKERPAQVGACSSSEMFDAMQSGRDLGMTDFVVVSHNFEMLRPDTSDPDWIVVRRFEKLCEFLANNSHTFPVCSFSNPEKSTTASGTRLQLSLPRVRTMSTLNRYHEQLLRRLR